MCKEFFLRLFGQQPQKEELPSAILTDAPFDKFLDIRNMTPGQIAELRDISPTMTDYLIDLVLR